MWVLYLCSVRWLFSIEIFCFSVLFRVVIVLCWIADCLCIPINSKSKSEPVEHKRICVSLATSKVSLVMCNLCFSLVVVMCTTWNQRQRIIIINWAHSCIASTLVHTATLPTKTGFFLLCLHLLFFSWSIFGAFYLFLFIAFFCRNICCLVLFFYIYVSNSGRERPKSISCALNSFSFSHSIPFVRGGKSTTLRLFTRIILCSLTQIHDF